MAAVPADIDEAREPVIVADYHHRHLAGIAGDVIADVFQFGQRPDVIPGFSEDLHDLLFGDRRVGVPVGRQRLAAIERREQAGGIVDALDHSDVAPLSVLGWARVAGRLSAAGG